MIKEKPNLVFQRRKVCWWPLALCEDGSYVGAAHLGPRALVTIADRVASVDQHHQPPIVAPMFDVTALGPEFKAKADELLLIVKRVEEKFAEQNPQGEDSFAALAVALFNYNAYKGKQVEADNLVALKDAFSLFRTSWGMQVGVKDKEFALSVMPVSYTHLTLPTKA